MVNSFVPAKAVKQHLKYLKKVKALRAKATSPEQLAAAMKKAFPKRGGAENLAEVAAICSSKRAANRYIKSGFITFDEARYFYCLFYKSITIKNS